MSHIEDTLTEAPATTAPVPVILAPRPARPAAHRLPRWFAPILAAVLVLAPAAGWLAGEATTTDEAPRAGRAALTDDEVMRTSSTFAPSSTAAASNPSADLAERFEGEPVSAGQMPAPTGQPGGPAATGAGRTTTSVSAERTTTTLGAPPTSMAQPPPEGCPGGAPWSPGGCGPPPLPGDDPPDTVPSPATTIIDAP